MYSFLRLRVFCALTLFFSGLQGPTALVDPFSVGIVTAMKQVSRGRVSRQALVLASLQARDFQNFLGIIYFVVQSSF